MAPAKQQPSPISCASRCRCVPDQPLEANAGQPLEANAGQPLEAKRRNSPSMRPPITHTESLPGCGTRITPVALLWQLSRLKKLPQQGNELLRVATTGQRASECRVRAQLLSCGTANFSVAQLWQLQYRKNLPQLSNWTTRSATTEQLTDCAVRSWRVPSQPPGTDADQPPGTDRRQGVGACLISRRERISGE